MTQKNSRLLYPPKLPLQTVNACLVNLCSKQRFNFDCFPGNWSSKIRLDRSCSVYWFLRFSPCSEFPSVVSSEYMDNFIGCKTASWRLPSWSDPLQQQQQNAYYFSIEISIILYIIIRVHEKCSRCNLQYGTRQFHFQHQVGGFERVHRIDTIFGVNWLEYVQVAGMRSNHNTIFFAIFQTETTAMQQTCIVILLVIRALCAPPRARFKQWHFNNCELGDTSTTSVLSHNEQLFVFVCHFHRCYGQRLRVHGTARPHQRSTCMWHMDTYTRTSIDMANINIYKFQPRSNAECSPKLV